MIDAVRAVAVRAAETAGEVLARGRREGVRVEAKGAADIVTETDREAERVIVEAIRAHFPAHGILGEEGAAREGDGWRWVIDPLDGTKNYAHGGLRCGVSIAVEHQGEAVVGVVFAPFVRERYVAVRGAGATCNEERISVSRNEILRASMVATALTYDGVEADAAQLQRVLRAFRAVQAVRSLGCAALDLCDVARGRLDAFFEPGLAAWDTAAGALIVREAGGRTTDLDGAAHTPGSRSIVASNGLIHDALRVEVRG